MLDKVDELIVGGGMAFTFLKVLHGMKVNFGNFFSCEFSTLSEKLFFSVAVVRVV